MAEKRNCGPASSSRIKAGMLEGVGHNLLGEVMKESGVMKTKNYSVSHFLKCALLSVAVPI